MLTIAKMFSKTMAQRLLWHKLVLAKYSFLSSVGNRIKMKYCVGFGNYGTEFSVDRIGHGIIDADNRK